MNKFIVFWEDYKSKTGPIFIAIEHIVQIKNGNRGTIIDLSNGKSIELDATPLEIINSMLPLMEIILGQKDVTYLICISLLIIIVHTSLLI